MTIDTDGEEWVSLDKESFRERVVWSEAFLHPKETIHEFVIIFFDWESTVVRQTAAGEENEVFVRSLLQESIAWDLVFYPLW